MGGRVRREGRRVRTSTALCPASSPRCRAAQSRCQHDPPPPFPPTHQKQNTPGLLPRLQASRHPCSTRSAPERLAVAARHEGGEDAEDDGVVALQLLLHNVAQVVLWGISIVRTMCWTKGQRRLGPLLVVGGGLSCMCRPPWLPPHHAVPVRLQHVMHRLARTSVSESRGFHGGPHAGSC